MRNFQKTSLDLALGVKMMVLAEIVLSVLLLRVEKGSTVRLSKRRKTTNIKKRLKYSLHWLGQYICIFRDGSGIGKVIPSYCQEVLEAMVEAYIFTMLVIIIFLLIGFLSPLSLQ